MSRANQHSTPPEYLNVFCLRHGDVWRVHAERHLLPQYLRHCFDEFGESPAVYLDMSDLERHMTDHHAPFEKRISIHGSVELTARGDSAIALAEWLATAFASGVRGGNDSSGEQVAS